MNVPSARLFSVGASVGPLLGLLFVATTAIRCEPLDEGPPPATPQTSMIPPPPLDAPAAASDPSAPSDPVEPPGDGEGAAYASDEVTVGGETDGYDDDDPAALADFRGALDPHGAWVDDPSYGTIWVPSAGEVGADFQPYLTAGHWAYENDWVWVSDYDWGWAPFHYGRWVWIAGRGWAWIPGRAYRGAWVTWGVDDGYTYLGWAPMGPGFLWFGGRPVGYSGYSAPRWVYCPRRDVFSPSVRTHVIAAAAAGPAAQRVRPFVSATPGVAGPLPRTMGFQPEQVPRATGTAAAGIARAQQFARPQTAQPLGARAPTRVATERMAPAGAAVRGPSALGPPSRALPSRTFTPAPRPAAAPTPVFRAPSGGSRGAAPAGAAGRTVSPAAPAAVPRGMRGPTFRGGGGGGHHR